MSKSPTLASFKRACTTSIGSICFGSLVIAVIQTLRGIAQMFRGDGNDGIMAFVACLIDCILGKCSRRHRLVVNIEGGIL